MLLSSNDMPENEAVQALIQGVFPPGLTVLDPTYGKGRFWQGWNGHLIRGDRVADRAVDVQLDFRALPFADKSVDLVVFDPPFQPTTTSGHGTIASQYSTVDGHINDVKALFCAGLGECWRVARTGIVVKVQDYIHNHQPVWMSFWAYDVLGEPYEFMTVRKEKRLKAQNWSRQRSVWRNHSTYWVWARRKFR